MERKKKMSNKYDMINDKGETFTMGANINDCVPGDGVKIGGTCPGIR